MTRDEWIRLRGYWYAKQNAPRTHSVGRRHAKGKGKGVGQVLLKSFIKSGINRHFPSHP
jgi:hypothetical protein